MSARKAPIRMCDGCGQEPATIFDCTGEMCAGCKEYADMIHVLIEDKIDAERYVPKANGPDRHEYWREQSRKRRAQK